VERKYVLKTPARLKTYRVDYDRELNDEQREVVLAGGGPLLVIAGAGSGKTRTLTWRVARLLADGELERTKVICPCHFAEFDVRTGAVLTPPATVPLNVYPVRVEGNDLQVEF